MKLTNLTPMLCVEDLQKTLKFYTEVLGFTCDEYNEEWGWMNLEKDEVRMMFARPNEHIPFTNSNFTGSFYFICDEPNLLFNELKEKVEIFYPIEDFEFGMREFAIKDCNGYLLQFGKVIE